MIRISDIIKMGPSDESDKRDKNKPQDSLLEKAFRKDAGKDIKQLYNQGIDLIKDVFDKARQAKELSPQQAEEYIANSIDFKLITNYIAQLIDGILFGETELFSYFYIYRQKGYLYEHSLNVCLLAVKIGVWMDMNKSDLVSLALGGLLHDLGLITVKDIISLPRKLSHKEMEKVKEHPVHSAKIVGKIKGLASDIIDVIRGHHRRISDEDFTKELSSEKLQKMSQIIGLADVYEAITHPRSYRGAKLPHEAIKELVENESDKFQGKIIKSLIDNIGIYPIGSWVRLTNGEIGLVVSINKGYPLRPKINIMFGAKGNKLEDVKSIDLLNEPHLHIESPIDLDKNKELIEKIK